MEVDFETGTTIQLALGKAVSINDRPMVAGQVVQPNEDALLSNDSETETAVVLITRLGE
jgi:hypothetical protein